MYNLLLKSLSEFITDPLSIVGLSIVAFSLALLCSAKNIARTIRKTKEVSNGDKAFVVTATIAVLMLCAGVVCIILSASSMFN